VFFAHQFYTIKELIGGALPSIAVCFADQFYTIKDLIGAA
jgi:hypothetical protein